METKYPSWSILLSVALGLGAGLVMHYALYRAGLPIQAFIYQAF